MQASDAPLRELLKARNAIQEMEVSKSLDELEELWKEFLHRLERSVNKARAHYKKSPKWDSWWGSYNKLRSKDPLLSYLINARGADEHSIENIVGKVGPGFGVNPVEGDTLVINSMTIVEGRMVLDSPHDVLIEFRPARIELKEITNRGARYEVPVVHLGTPIGARDVVTMARLGYNFYEDFLNKAHQYFVK